VRTTKLEVDRLQRELVASGGKIFMTRADLRHLARLGAGAFMLLVIQCIVAPDLAWAGCSHPIGSQSDPFRDLRQLDALFAAGPSSISDGDLSRFPMELPARRSPCSGMSCSSRDSLPISTAVPVVEGPQQWVAALVFLTDLDAAAPAGRTDDEPASAATGEDTSIFHPPRA
jgi:hypothetical protein